METLNRQPCFIIYNVWIDFLYVDIDNVADCVRFNDIYCWFLQYDPSKPLFSEMKFSDAKKKFSKVVLEFAQAKLSYYKDTKVRHIQFTPVIMTSAGSEKMLYLNIVSDKMSILVMSL